MGVHVSLLKKKKRTEGILAMEKLLQRLHN
jgi:hypothetical protein